MSIAKKQKGNFVYTFLLRKSDRIAPYEMDAKNRFLPIVISLVVALTQKVLLTQEPDLPESIPVSHLAKPTYLY